MFLTTLVRKQGSHKVCNVKHSKEFKNMHFPFCLHPPLMNTPPRHPTPSHNYCTFKSWRYLAVQFNNTNVSPGVSINGMLC